MRDVGVGGPVAGGVYVSFLYLATSTLLISGAFGTGAAGDCGHDSAGQSKLESRVVLAPIVFLARARGRGPLDVDGLYGVTFQITALLKGSMPPQFRSQVRLTYRKPVRHRPAVDVDVHVDMDTANLGIAAANAVRPRGRRHQQHKLRHQHRRRGGDCHVEATVRTGRDYYVFAELASNLNLTAFAPPASANKRTQRIVAHSVCGKCGGSIFNISYLFLP